MSQVIVELEQEKSAVAARTAPGPSLLAELMLATPGLLSSSSVSTTVFLATSVVEVCAVKRELLTTEVDKHFALGRNVHFTCTLLPFTSRRLK